MKDVFNVVGVIALAGASIFGVAYGGYRMYAFFAPRYVAVDNRVFQESQQYNEGMVRDLENLRMQYMSATPEQREALRALVLHRFSVYPEDKLPPDLLAFYSSLKGIQ